MGGFLAVAEDCEDDEATLWVCFLGASVSSSWSSKARFILRMLVVGCSHVIDIYFADLLA